MSMTERRRLAPSARTPPCRDPAWALLGMMTGLNVLNFVDRQLIAEPRAAAHRRPRAQPVADWPARRLRLRRVLHAGRHGAGRRRRPLVAARHHRVGPVALERHDRRVRRGARASSTSPSRACWSASARPRSRRPRCRCWATRFPARRLGLATGIYYAGLPIGTALSLVVAGWVAPRFGWRACFYVFGAIGLLAVGLLFAVREPLRARGASARRAGIRRTPSLGAIVGDLRRALAERPSLGLVMLGGAGLAYGSAAALHGITWLVAGARFHLRQRRLHGGPDDRHVRVPRQPRRRLGGGLVRAGAGAAAAAGASCC